MEIKEGSRHSMLIVVLVAIILLLLAGNGLTMFYLYQNNKLIKDTGLLTNNQNTNVAQENDPQDENKLVVEWLVNDTAINTSEFIKKEKASTKLLQEIEKIKAAGDSQYSFEAWQKGIDIRLVGKISQGKYQGYNLYVMIVTTNIGMPSTPIIYRFVSNKEQNIILSKNSEQVENNEEIGSNISDFFNNNDKVEITNLSIPNEIKVSSSAVVLRKNTQSVFPASFFYTLTDLSPLFKYDGQNYLYQHRGLGDNSSCFLIRTADGLVQDYVYDLNNEQPVDTTQINLKLQLSNGEFYSGQYSYLVRNTCGGKCLETANYLESSKIEFLGTNDLGEKFYKFKDSNQKIKATDENSILQNIYDQYFPGYDEKLKKNKEKLPYTDYLKTLPVIVWQDSFKNYFLLKNLVYTPAVECGKPVIYLYPEKEMAVNVQVAPTGGFTITEPEYNNGWQVIAKPNGDLWNLADQEWYPYLFWEGHGLNYDIPKQGFVVSKTEVEKFLRSTLPKLGLIPKEYEEFISYWLPRLQKDNYYFITFVEQAYFDQLAPLTVQPRPDTVIRVFMDFQGLSQYQKVQPLPIKTPVRKGFTVVEWGGAIHR